MKIIKFASLKRTSIFRKRFVCFLFLSIAIYFYGVASELNATKKMRPMNICVNVPHTVMRDDNNREKLNKKTITFLK